MTRHPVDWLSLIVGALGVLVAVASLTDLRLGAVVGDVGPLAAVIVGLAVLGAALRGTRAPQPAADRPARHNPDPATPHPATPGPGTRVPATPTRQNPASQTPVREHPDPDDSIAERARAARPATDDDRA